MCSIFFSPTAPLHRIDQKWMMLLCSRFSSHWRPGERCLSICCGVHCGLCSIPHGMWSPKDHVWHFSHFSLGMTGTFIKHNMQYNKQAFTPEQRLFLFSPYEYTLKPIWLNTVCLQLTLHFWIARSEWPKQSRRSAQLTWVITPPDVFALLPKTFQ